MESPHSRSDGLTLLSLPYDIRYLIYQQLFPQTNQLHLQAWQSGFQCITPDHNIPTPLLRTCRRLHSEASGFLYNHYLFNILGRKRDCLRIHDAFLPTLRKYAQDSVQVHAFGNGAHSGTMCISLHAGQATMEDVVRRRERGVARRIEDVRAEVCAGDARQASSRRWWWYSRIDALTLWLLTTGMAVLVCVLAWEVAMRRSLP